jgi:hypothetical protein
MTDRSASREEKKASADLCWICNRNGAKFREHKTKRSDLAAVLGSPTQERPLYFHDLERRNKPVRSLDAKILKAPIRICHECNTGRTQPHDRAWEHMSDQLRSRRLVIGQSVRANGLFRHDTRRQMINVHLFFLKLFGCMLCEAKASGYDVPIDIVPFSEAIMTSRPHSERCTYNSESATAPWDGLTCIAGRRSTAACLPVGSISWTASPLACCLRRRGCGSIVPIYGTRSLTQAPNASRSRILCMRAA